MMSTNHSTMNDVSTKYHNIRDTPAIEELVVMKVHSLGNLLHVYQVDS